MSNKCSCVTKPALAPNQWRADISIVPENDRNPVVVEFLTHMQSWHLDAADGCYPISLTKGHCHCLGIFELASQRLQLSSDPVEQQETRGQSWLPIDHMYMTKYCPVVLFGSQGSELSCYVHIRTKVPA